MILYVQDEPKKTLTKLNYAKETKIELSKYQKYFDLLKLVLFKNKNRKI
jgi:hypothetical protein